VDPVPVPLFNPSLDPHCLDNSSSIMSSIKFSQLVDSNQFEIDNADAGGGTVDITVHTVHSKGGQKVLAEATARVGGEYGSTFVDAAFERMIMQKLGLPSSAYDVWAKAHPDEYYALMSKWEVTKCCFAKDGRGAARANDETYLVTAVMIIFYALQQWNPAASVRLIKIHNGAMS
jgi:hypothetical protein